MSAVHGMTYLQGQRRLEKSLTTTWMSVSTIVQRLGFAVLIAAAGLLTGYLLSARSRFATVCAVLVACSLFPLLFGCLLRLKSWTINRCSKDLHEPRVPYFADRRSKPKDLAAAESLAFSPDSQFSFEDQMLLEDVFLNYKEAPGSKYLM